jgi:DnaJ-class molecular chaperone
MPDTIKCPTCNGSGSFEALVSQHDDKTETSICNTCHGSGVIHQMTDEEERDYMADHW